MMDRPSEKSSKRFYPSETAPLLVEWEERIPSGPVLDVAAGAGRHALHLARKGRPVVAVERDPEALGALRREAAGGLPLDVVEHDLEAVPRLPDPPAGAPGFSAVLVFYYLQRDLFPEIMRVLAPGGLLLYETFTIDQHIRFGKPRRTHFCLQPNELLRAFLPLTILYYREGWLYPERAVAQLVAGKAP